MKKTTILVILALICAVSKIEGQVNPKITQLFEEFKETKTNLFNRPPTIVKRGGMDGYGSQPSLDYYLISTICHTLFEAGKTLSSWIAFCE